MATPTPRRYPQVKPPAPTHDIDPLWIVRALCLALLAAAALGYGAVCLLVYQGGWQRMLHPSPAIAKTPAKFGIPFEAVSFDAVATGTPRLTAWWLPSDSSTAPTILFLHEGNGSLSNALPSLELLRRANVNIFAIDYRGFGLSAGPHPTEARMAEDAAAAFTYLTETRHIPRSKIVPYGVGLASSLAVNLANANPGIPACIVDYPDTELLAKVLGDDRSRLLPMRTLIREHFDLPLALAHSTQPRLLLADHPGGYESARVKAAQAVYRNAPDPKVTVTFGNVFAEDAYLQTIRRFLDENIH